MADIQIMHGMAKAYSCGTFWKGFFASFRGDNFARVEPAAEKLWQPCFSRGKRTKMPLRVLQLNQPLACETSSTKIFLSASELVDLHGA